MLTLIFNRRVAGALLPPVALPGTLRTQLNTPADGTLEAINPPGSPPLTFVLVDTAGAHGVVTLLDAALGTYHYDPDPDYAGQAAFTFKADNGLDSNVAVVTITVGSAAPVFGGGSPGSLRLDLAEANMARLHYEREAERMRRNEREAVELLLVLT